jgi:hypothetical protein
MASGLGKVADQGRRLFYVVTRFQRRPEIDPLRRLKIDPLWRFRRPPLSGQFKSHTPVDRFGLPASRRRQLSEGNGSCATPGSVPSGDTIHRVPAPSSAMMSKDGAWLMRLDDELARARTGRSPRSTPNAGRVLR